MDEDDDAQASGYEQSIKWIKGSIQVSTSFFALWLMVSFSSFGHQMQLFFLLMIATGGWVMFIGIWKRQIRPLIPYEYEKVGKAMLGLLHFVLMLLLFLAPQYFLLLLGQGWKSNHFQFGESLFTIIIIIFVALVIVNWWAEYVDTNSSKKICQPSGPSTAPTQAKMTQLHTV